MHTNNQCLFLGFKSGGGVKSSQNVGEFSFKHKLHYKGPSDQRCALFLGYGGCKETFSIGGGCFFRIICELEAINVYPT